MKVNKRILSLILAATLVSASLVGCGELDSTATVLTIGGENVSAGVANFYARYEQAMNESYYMSMLGEDMWIQDMGDGATFEDGTKADIMGKLQELYVISQRAEELEISISDEELEAINEAADAFIGANTNEEYNALTSITKENVVEVLTLFTLQNKAEPIIKADVDTDMNDEETVQKKMTIAGYLYSYTDEDGETVQYSEEEQGQMLSNLEGLKTLTSGNLLSNAEAIDVVVEELTFDKNSVTIDATVIEVADELGLNAYSDVIETAEGIYLVQLTSMYDKEASDIKIAEIIEERATELYNVTIQEWIEEAEAKVVDSVWNEIVFDKLKINLPGVTTDSDSGVTTYNSTYEYGSGQDSEEEISEEETDEQSEEE